MSLVNVAFLPHSPFLIPELNQKYSKKLQPLVKLMTDLNGELYQQKIQTLIVITSHGLSQPATYVLNHALKLNGDYKDFGLPNQKFSYHHDLSLAYQLKEKYETSLSITLSPSAELDYGSLVPLSFCTKNLPGLKIIVIYSSNLPSETDLLFGQAIREICENSNKRLAVLVCGDLAKILDKKKASHELAKKYDQEIIKALSEHNLNSLPQIPQNIIDLTHQCSQSPLTILAGIMGETKFNTTDLTYLNFSGVGLLAAKLHLN